MDGKGFKRILIEMTVTKEFIIRAVNAKDRQTDRNSWQGLQEEFRLLRLRQHGRVSEEMA